MNFIILADKYQKGNKSKGCVGLIKVSQKINVFEHQYKLIKNNFENFKIVYVYGFDHKKMTNYIDKKKYENLIAIHNEQYEEYNYAYALSLASEYITKDCFVFFGDAIFKKDIFKNFCKDTSQIYVNNKQKNALGCVINKNEIVQNISFDLDNYLMDIYYLKKKDSEIMRSFVMNTDYKNCFIFEIINKMVDSGVEFKANIKNRKNICSKINKLRVEL